MFVRNVILLVAASCACAAPQRPQTVARTVTLGDIIHREPHRVIIGVVSVELPPNWHVFWSEGETAILQSPDYLHATIRVTHITCGELRRCDSFSSSFTCQTEITSPLRTDYGAVWWEQTAWIDNGDNGAFRIEARWANVTPGRLMPPLIGLIARSARAVL